MTLLFQMKVLYQHVSRFSMFHVKLFIHGEGRKFGQNDRIIRYAEMMNEAADLDHKFAVLGAIY